MNEAILCCKCGQTPKYSEESFHLIKKNAPTPPIYAGSSQIAALKTPENSNIGKYVRSLVSNKGKFSYYMAWDADGMVTEQWDLLKGRRLV